MKEIIYIVLVAWTAIGIASLQGEFCEIEKEIKLIEQKTERMKVNPRPHYVTAPTY